MIYLHTHWQDTKSFTTRNFLYNQIKKKKVFENQGEKIKSHYISRMPFNKSMHSIHQKRFIPNAFNKINKIFYTGKLLFTRGSAPRLPSK